MEKEANEVSAFAMIGSKNCRTKGCNELAQFGQYCTDEHEKTGKQVENNRTVKVMLSCFIFLNVWPILPYFLMTMTEWVLAPITKTGSNGQLVLFVIYFCLTGFAFVKFVFWLTKDKVDPAKKAA